MNIDEKLRLQLIQSSDQRWEEAKEKWRNGDLLQWFLRAGTADMKAREVGADAIRELSDEDLLRMYRVATLAIGEVMMRVEERV
jgi:hypothetical protein